MPLVQGCLWAQMRSFDHIETHPGGREEVLDDISEDFPYLSVLSQHDRYHERTAPWHWHQELELFYVLEGDRAGVRDRMYRAFETAMGKGDGWELRLRDELSEVWLDFVELARPRLSDGPAEMPRPREERLRAMLDFVGRHYAERISVADVAAAAFASERECHRTFREELGVTPAQYLRDYRIQQACRMLAHTTRPIAAVGEMSGLGTASHFGQVFRAAMGCTPREYRSRWQD